MNDELTSIKKASFVKRILAIIMDGSVAIFTFFAFFLLVFSPIATKAFGYKDAVNKASDIQLETHLYEKVKEKDQRNTPIYKIKKEETELNYYTERLEYYYCVYKTTIAPDKESEILKDDGTTVKSYEYYPEYWNNVKGEIVDVKTAQNFAYEATSDCHKYWSEYQMKARRCEIFIIMPSFVISFGVFFILVPLLYKNGETFGKKFLGLGFVTKDGYGVKKRQIVLRQLFLLFLTTISCFTLTIGFGSLILLGAGVFIYYLAAFIIKDNRSFADLFAYTMLIDCKNSVWFKDVKEENEKQKIVAENLEKYNKVKVDNKHILQVGGEIVDEQAKEEYLKSKDKK